jgi:hypothetical protein
MLATASACEKSLLLRTCSVSAVSFFSCVTEHKLILKAKVFLPLMPTVGLQMDTKEYYINKSVFLMFTSTKG